MKNERIITHFQSYTTALGCVKDLTPYFAGRISIITPTNGMNSTLTAKNGGQGTTSGGQGGGTTVVDELGEIGGISLGAAAYLVPGLSPVLVGGPIAGMAMGDAISSYVMGRMTADEQDPTSPTTRDKGKKEGQNGSERYFVVVDVDSDEEAAMASSIMQRHGAQSERATGNGNGNGDRTNPTPAPERPRPRTDFVDPCEVERYDRIVDHPNTVEAPWDEQDEESPMTGIHAPYSQDGYTLAPIAPISPQGWIDANIGYGNYDIVDPSRMTDFDDDGNTNR